MTDRPKPYLQDLVYDLSGLFELLDVAEKEWKGTE
jgi:hypothetical protein